MGCDIHMYKEKHVDGKWESADKWVPYDYGDDEKGQEVPFQSRYTGRNYELFGLLSKGVRTEHPFSFEARGIPFDCCAEIAAERAGWDVDGHSASYLFLHELKAMQKFLKNTAISIAGMKNKEELKELRASIASGSPDWNLLFPYCKWASNSDYENFDLEVPASFYMGEDLQKIISSFDGIEGDNHRIVFFFDN